MSDPAEWPKVVAELAPNVLASGITAYCQISRLRAGKEYQETLANHDILRIVETAWAEAALASLKLYGEFKGEALPILEPEFAKALSHWTEKDFANRVSVGSVREAVTASRRALLADQADPTPQATQLANEIVDGVMKQVETLFAGKVSIPVDLKGFLSGEHPRFREGLLGQLCIYVAFHLKTDQRAQLAILHFTLQEIVDDQKKLQDSIDGLCAKLSSEMSTSQQQAIAVFEARLTQEIAELRQYIDKRFNEEHQPALEVPFAEDRAMSGKDFTYRARRTRLVGRGPALESLVEFMGDERNFLWTVISGPAGTGKSRLAAELVHLVRRRARDVHPGEWRAGFLQFSQEWLKDDARKWTPDADALIVIDYAQELSNENLAQVLNKLRRTNAAKFQLRIVFVDRYPPDSDFGLVKRLNLGESSAIEDRWLAVAPSPNLDGLRVDPTENGSPADPLILRPSSSQDALEIARDWAGSSWTNEAAERITRAMVDDPDLGRPLFAALLGDAIASDHLPPGQLNPVNVASAALKKLYKAMKSPSPEAEFLWAVATAGQGLLEPLLTKVASLAALTGKENWSNAELNTLQHDLRRISGGTANELIPPLEPDFLGELLFLKCLLKIPQERMEHCTRQVMELAWNSGAKPAAFLIRLAGDFVNRLPQLERALAELQSPPPAGAAEKLLINLLTIGLEAQSNRQAAARVVSQSVYLAARSGQLEVAKMLLDRLSSNCNMEQLDGDAAELARAWFGYCFSGDLPPNAQKVRDDGMVRMEMLWVQHQTRGVAEWYAQALMNGTLGEPNAEKREMLAERIGKLRESHDTPEIAFAQAMALYNATVVERNVGKREMLAERIEKVRERHDTAEVALAQAQALMSATVGEPHAWKREILADKIGRLRERHNTVEIALLQARALMNATLVEPFAGKREELAERIGQLRCRHDTAEIASAYAKALMSATAVAPNPRKRESLAERIGQVRTRHNTAEIAREQVNALYNAAIVETDARQIEALAERIGHLRKSHDTAEIALRHAIAWSLAGNVLKCNVKLSEVVDRVRQIKLQYNTPEISRFLALSILFSMKKEPDQPIRAAHAASIAALHIEHPCPELARLSQIAQDLVANWPKPED